MMEPVNSLLRMLRRWRSQQDTAIRQFGSKTMGQRLAAYGKSERVEAKFFLLAMLPFIPNMVSDEMGLQRNVAWHVWFWLAVAWATGILLFMLLGLWRALLRSINRRK